MIFKLSIHEREGARLIRKLVSSGLVYKIINYSELIESIRVELFKMISSGSIDDIKEAYPNSYEEVKFVSTIDKDLIDFVDIEFVIANINKLNGLERVIEYIEYSEKIQRKAKYLKEINRLGWNDMKTMRHFVSTNLDEQSKENSEIKSCLMQDDFDIEIDLINLYKYHFFSENTIYDSVSEEWSKFFAIIMNVEAKNCVELFWEIGKLKYINPEQQTGLKIRIGESFRLTGSLYEMEISKNKWSQLFNLYKLYNHRFIMNDFGKAQLRLLFLELSKKISMREELSIDDLIELPEDESHKNIFLEKVDAINKASEFDNIIFSSEDWEMSIMDRV